MTARRELTGAAVLLAAAGALLSLAAGRAWLRLDVAGRQVHAVSGRELTEVPLSLGLLALAAAAALLALRGRWRVVLGVLVVAAGVTAAISSVRHAADRAADVASFAYAPIDPAATVHVGATAWPWVSAAAAVLVAVAGAWVVVRGGRWPALGARYDAPGARRERVDAPTAAWDALDRGDDPTQAE